MSIRLPSGPFSLAAAVVIGGLGGGLFTLAGLPAAWLSGAMVAVGIAALVGLSATVPARLRDATYVLLGVSMGAGIDPDLLARLGDWPASLAGLAIAVGFMIAGSYFWLRRVSGWDAASAYFGSIPGALSMTLVTAESSRADIRRVALSQTLRLFLLVGVLPMVVTAVDPAGVVAPAVARVHGWGPLALLLVAGLVGSAVGHRLRIPAGILIGAFIASGILHGTGVVEGALPNALQAPALILLGTMLGLRFSGTDLRMLGSTLSAGVGAFLAAFAAALAGAWVVAGLTGLGLGQTLIAYAPGGLEVMVILAFALKVDPAFVAAHHLARFVAMTMLVPGLARLVLGPGWSAAPTPEALPDRENEALPDDEPPVEPDVSASS